jgi:FAD:protein FMN transferase
MRTLLSVPTLKTLMALAVGVFLWLLLPERHTVAPVQVQVLQGNTMGTTWQVQVATSSDAKLADSGAAVIAALARLDQEIFSTYAPDSELSRLNRTPVGESLSVSRELLEVLLLARTINQQSFGTFDVTVGPLVNLWGFGPQPQQAVPAEAAVAEAMAQLGADQYQINFRAGTVQRSANITLDLSAIAKGYAVDQVADMLLAAGYAHFLVEIGGEVRVQGWHAPEQSWVIAIETPQSAPALQLPFARIDNLGQGFALAGSGDYRNFFEQDGKRYSHAINPLTGRPIDHALAAVTVMAATAAEADAWATAMMVLGPVDGPLLAEKLGLAVYFIIRGDTALESRYTQAFEPYLMAVTKPR